MILELYLISENRDNLVTPEIIASTDADLVQIGREPSDPKGIALDSKTVSRVHGVFNRINGHWFFKDLGSSNGSWLNGRHLPAEEHYILRSGDELQLADSFLGIRIISEDEIPASALVFSREDLLSEIEVPGNGKFLTVGGHKADYKLDVDLGSLPQFILEKRSGFVCVYPVSSENRATVNGVMLDNILQLKDRDVVELPPYRIIMHLPAVKALSSESFTGSRESGQLASWDEIEKAPKSHLFGRARADTAEFGLDPAKIVDAPEEKRDLSSKLDSVEEKLVAILGFLLVLLILGAVLWWFLR